jgi:hypothetical protein
MIRWSRSMHLCCTNQYYVARFFFTWSFVLTAMVVHNFWRSRCAWRSQFATKKTARNLYPVIISPPILCPSSLWQNQKKNMRASAIYCLIWSFDFLKINVWGLMGIFTTWLFKTQIFLMKIFRIGPLTEPLQNGITTFSGSPAITIKHSINGDLLGLHAVRQIMKTFKCII